MNDNGLTGLYYQWILDLIGNDGYSMLLKYLYLTDFCYTLNMDGNRYDDGIELRYRFGYENNIDYSAIAEELDHKPCSILEMMVALSVRCEEHIMDNPEIGDRTGYWFWEMIKNLGLYEMTDDNYNPEFVCFAVNRFLNHEYRMDGKGGLFTVQNSRIDMRQTEIWYQMMWYLDEKLK